jgi:hypothetical protein
VRGDARKETYVIKWDSRLTWHVTANEVSPQPVRPRFGYHQDTPPNVLACDHDWRQVSWLAGRRPSPPSQTRMSSGYWRKARRLQLRGQPRNRTLFKELALTAFPFDPRRGTVTITLC